MDDPNARTARNSAPSPPRWKGTTSLGPVQRLNERCLQLLQRAASSDLAAAPAVLAQHHDLWIALDPAARQRLAKLPFVILDAEFRNDTWWRFAGDPVVRQVELRNALSDFSRDLNEGLVHELILFAWQVAGTDRAVAQLSFGMTPAVSEIIATLNSQQVRALTMQPSARASLRWADDVDLWRDLLTAAAGDDARLYDLQLYAKVRFCGEIIHGAAQLASG
jgi:hypothetical protein